MTRRLDVSIAGPRRAAGGTLIGMFIGLILGLALAAGVAYTLSKGGALGPSRPSGKDAGKIQSPVRTESLPADRAAADKAGADKAAADKAAPDKGRFEFYRVLPGMDDARKAADKAERPPEKTPVAKSEPAPRSTDRYVLQAGAFRTDADAENQKARLALLGYEALVQRATTAEGVEVFRVRVGPYTSVDEMNRIKSELSNKGVEVAVIKNP